MAKNGQKRLKKAIFRPFLSDILNFMLVNQNGAPRVRLYVQEPSFTDVLGHIWAHLGLMVLDVRLLKL